MRIELELWQFITLVAMVMGAFFGMAKMLLAATQRAIDAKFIEIGAHMNKQDESSRRLERDLMELKAELPRDYVRREDYTQAIATILTKMDALGMRVENMFKDLMLRERRE